MMSLRRACVWITWLCSNVNTTVGGGVFCSVLLGPHKGGGGGGDALVWTDPFSAEFDWRGPKAACCVHGPAVLQRTLALCCTSRGFLEGRGSAGPLPHLQEPRCDPERSKAAESALMFQGGNTCGRGPFV